MIYTHVFQKKMVAEIFIVPQVASNNGGDTQDPPPINVGSAPASEGSLYHIEYFT